MIINIKVDRGPMFVNDDCYSFIKKTNSLYLRCNQIILDRVYCYTPVFVTVVISIWVIS